MGVDSAARVQRRTTMHPTLHAGNALNCHSSHALALMGRRLYHKLNM
jgi:hypothetical protein